MLHLISDMARV